MQIAQHKITKQINKQRISSNKNTQEENFQKKKKEKKNVNVNEIFIFFNVLTIFSNSFECVCNFQYDMYIRESK